MFLFTHGLNPRLLNPSLGLNIAKEVRIRRAGWLGLRNSLHPLHSFFNGLAEVVYMSCSGAALEFCTRSWSQAAEPSACVVMGGKGTPPMWSNKAAGKRKKPFSVNIFAIQLLCVFGFLKSFV